MKLLLILASVLMLSACSFIEDGKVDHTEVVEEEIVKEEVIEDQPTNEFNYDPANATMSYSSKEKGITLDIPYNKNWSHGGSTIEPYQDHGSSISFGQIGPRYGDQCCSREYDLEFSPPESAETVIARLSPEFKARTEEINVLPVIKLEDAGLCIYPTIIVIGEKHNYEFKEECGDDFEEGFKKLSKIVETVQLIK